MFSDSISIFHLEPSLQLKPFIRKISVFKSNKKIFYSQKLTPSPYNYLSFNHKDIPTSVFINKEVKPKDRLMLAGIKTEEIHVKYEGVLSQILFEFSATGFFRLFHKKPLRYKNQIIPFKEIHSSDLTKKLNEELLKTHNSEKHIEIIQNYLQSKISGAFPEIDYIEESVKLIEDHHGRLLIKNIAERVKVSERQLNRKFSEIVGITPKKFSKIIQLHYIIHLIQEQKYDFEDIVFKSYFFDRPHLTKSFKEHTGMTPIEFLNSDKHIAFKFFNL